MVDATIQGLEKEEANFQVFNIGTGTPTSVIEIAKSLITEYHSETELIVSGNFRLGDIRHNYADMTKSRQLLGFTPKYQFDTGISRFVKWVNSQGILEDNYSASINELKIKGLLK